MMIVCINEDRGSEFVAVKLLILSLARHCPDLKVKFSSLQLPEGFERWLSSFPQVEFVPAGRGGNYDIKPYRLLEHLDSGHDEVIWLDSDIIITRDFRPLLAGLSPETFVVAEEPPEAWRCLDHASAWGLPGRVMPRVFNSGVLRVTDAHRGLLESWARLLERDDYREAQSRPYKDRPYHQLGDQDALNAILGSEEYAGMPIRALHCGREIIQYFSKGAYSVSDRLHNMIHGLPPFVHSMANRPWRHRDKPAQVSMDLSPYLHVAREYRDQIGEEVDWMEPRTTLGRLLRMIPVGTSAQGLPMVALWEFRHRNDHSLASKRAREGRGTPLPSS